MLNHWKTVVGNKIRKILVKFDGSVRICINPDGNHVILKSRERVACINPTTGAIVIY